MAIIVNSEASKAGSISGVLPAFDGLRADVTTPAGTDPGAAPGGGPVVGWALLDDPSVAGGARLEPVFLAAGRAWTPDQYRAVYGQQLSVRVGRG
ncbi:hypothetical protein [Streptomyces sp. NBC_00338]|uniref:hypothetical protein n=1 Tax=Streptomyces sp. NBC_00338 TaxID=2975715 RepID=UPI002253C7F9|nr:hypothetical protein [Streptomyces sp. NBC_00338]MCX5144629.1 hypothetical protein [Streptomyces sp. NBC_00338]MCX5145075.1 hypothetical protein [Streptomyces sp. NBC_00338]